jgi:DNA polymerase-3 subunit delta
LFFAFVLILFLAFNPDSYDGGIDNPNMKIITRPRGTDLDLDAQTLEAAEMDAGSFTTAADTLPFLSPLRLVVVQNVDQLSAKDERLKALVSYVQNPNPTTVLALTAQKQAKSTRLYKAVAEVGNIIDRKSPGRKELPRYVDALFAEVNLQPKSGATTTLINLVGDDLSSLGTAIKKLASYKNATADMTAPVVVSRDDIAQIIGETSEVKAWEFTDALANRNAGKALKILDRLTETEGERVHYFATFMAAGKVRELLTARALIERGESGADALNAQLKTQSSKGKGRILPDWLAQKTFTQAGQFTAAELADYLRDLAQVEQTMKTSPPQLGRLALTRWVVKFCC